MPLYTTKPYFCTIVGMEQFFDFTFSPLMVVLGALGLVFLIQLYYYLGVFTRLTGYKRQDVPANQQPVSIIICAKNEEDNLMKYLPLLLTQNYPKFEVIVVNDCSWDESYEKMLRMQPDYPHLEIRNIAINDHYEHGKKFALSIGIKAAKYDQLLLTDADCRPASQDWLKLMQRNFTDKKTIILGFSPYERGKGFLNKVIRYDTFLIGVHYLTQALRGKTYMGVGRNLSYEKELFFNVKGFASHMHVMSGDDDLFIQEVATKTNVAIEIDHNAHTLSAPKKTWADWFTQKRRHISTAPLYPASTRSFITTYFVSTALFYLLLTTLAVFLYNWPILIAVFLVRLVIMMVVLGNCAKKLNEKPLVGYIPLLDLVMLIVYPLISVSKLLVRKNKWS